MDMGKKNNLSRIAALAIALTAAVGLSGCSLFTPTRDEVPPKTVRTKVTTPVIATKGVLTVALDGSDAPQAMDDGEGGLTGYAVDVSYAIAERLGLRVEFVTDEGPDAVGSDAADIYIGATDDDETEDVAVTGVYLEDAPALFSREEGDGSVLAASDLAGLTVGVQTSSRAQDVLTATGVDIQQKTYGNVNECLSALCSGEVDLVACDATAGAYLSRAFSGVHFAGVLDTPESFGIALRARNTDLEAAIEDALDDLAADGTLEAIHVAWYGGMPVSISDSMVSGIMTSEEREQAEEERRRAEEAAAGDEDSAEDEGAAEEAA